MKNNTVEFTDIKPGLQNIAVGSKLDNAQYIALTLKSEADRIKGRLYIGKFAAASGKKYPVSINGQPTMTDSDGVFLQGSPMELSILLKDGRENEINFDTLAYLEVEGETSSGKNLSGVFYTLADIQKYVEEEQGGENINNN